MQGWNEVPEEEALRLKEWRDGYGDWWRGFEWSHYVHLTTGEQREALARTGGSGAFPARRGRRLRKVRGVWRVSAPAMGWERLSRTFVDEFCRYCTKVALAPVCYAYVIEKGTLGGRAHLHGLLYASASLDCSKLEDAWRHGLARVLVYNPLLGGAHYNSKEIGRRCLHHDVSSRMPPRRVGGPPSKPA